jgi:hypothetical protein
MYTLRAQGGTPIIRHTAVVGGQKWCLLDSGAGFSRPLLNHLEGTYQPESCSVVTPSRWDAQFPWRPFIPTASNESLRPWYFLDPGKLQASRISELGGQYQLDLRSLEVCANDLCEKYPEYRGKRPKEYHVISFASLDSIRASQEAMLDLIGFLSWCTAWYDGLTFDLRPLKNQTNIVLNKLRYAFNSRAGVIVDLAKDWKTANFPLWAYHGVPILFQWTPAEQGDPRFSHVSPDQFPSTGTFQQRGTTYDWFFQDRSRDFDDVPLGGNVRRVGNYIIDFEGWKRRSLDKTAATAYFGVLAFTPITIGRHGQALFFRWRTKISLAHSEDPDLVDRNRDDAESEEQAMRELYRPHYAPQLHNLYDINTGLCLPISPPTSSAQMQRTVLPSNSSHETSFSRNTAPYRYHSPAPPTTHPVHGLEWPLPRPVHVNSPWRQTQTPAWTLPDEDGGRSLPNLRHRVDDQQWTPADASSGPERGIRTRRIARREGHGHGTLYQKDKFSSATLKHHLGPWNVRDSRYEVDRGLSAHNTPSSSSAADNTYISSGAKPSVSSRAETAPSHVSNSLMPSSSSTVVWDLRDSRHVNDRRFSARNSLSSSSASENNYASLGATRPLPSVSEITVLQHSNLPISSPSSTALQPTASGGLVESGVDNAAVSQQPKTKMSFAEYKARKRRQEKHAAPTECEGSAGTTEGIPNPPSSLPSVDVEMFLPTGPAPVVECPAAMAPKVRFLRPEFRTLIKLIHCITVWYGRCP